MLEQLRTSNFANEEARALAENEVERLRSYKKIYLETHPLPKKRSVNFIQSLGVEALAAGLSSIGALVLAAIRTGTVFYQAENSLLAVFNTTGFLNTTLPLVSMIAALFAVEGYLFVQGLKKGRSENNRGAIWGMIFAIAISVMAGIISSSGLITNLSGVPKMVLYVALAVVTGIGATVLAYYGAENLGIVFLRWEQLQTFSEDVYSKQVLAWDEAAQRAYHRQGRTGIFGLESLQPETTAKKKVKPTKEATDISQNVRQYLKDHNLNASDIGQETGLIMTPAQLAKEIDGTGGAVRTALSRIRKEEKIVSEDIPAVIDEPKYVPVDEDPIF